jgi:hypothetical protein
MGRGSRTLGPVSSATLEDVLEEEDVDLDEPSLGDDEPLTEDAKEFVHWLTIKTLTFLHALCADPEEDRVVAGEHCLYPYEYVFAYRVIESVILNDGSELTALFARQSGKTQTVAACIATIMLLFPRLAKRYPTWLGHFRRGVKVGCFAPVEDQAQTLFARIVHFLTSDQAVELMEEPDIQEDVDAGGKLLTLTKCKSFVRLQTAHERANIESKTYDIILVDEAQDADEKVVRKSIHPMGASTNATIIKTGTPTYTKGDFYKAIRKNKREQVKRGAKQNHYEANWREVIRYNPRYKKYIAKEIGRIGEESDEFQLSYNLKWLLERGMFTTEEKFDSLGDRKMKVIQAWRKSPLLAGLDVARRQDSTVATVIWVDWENPDEQGLFDHRVLNWLEIHGDNWEEQYAQVFDFFAPYDIVQLGVDGQGMGDLFADRMSRLMPNTDVLALGGTIQEQSKRWKHLTQLMQRNLISWPAHPDVRRTQKYKRFKAQMTDAERSYKGGNMVVAAPDENDAHDDYVDSLGLAVWLTKEISMPSVEVSENIFYESRSRRYA